MSKVQVAVVQACPVFLDKEKTFEKLRKLITEASKTGAQLVVFPKLLLEGTLREVISV